MVRFARAKGSKASNERRPEEATSWQEMKQQMIQVKERREQADEVTVHVDLQEDSNVVETSWAKFEESKVKKTKKVKNTSPRPSMERISEETQQPTKKKKKKNHSANGEHKTQNQKTENILHETYPSEETSPVIKHKKVKKRLRDPSEDQNEDKKILKLKKKKQKFDTFIARKDSSENFKQEEKRGMTRFQKKQAGFSITRRKPISSTISIGGKEVEIIPFDGFPILKEDWERLIELKKKMKVQKIPEDKIKAAMKLERRRAEKNLARQRKKVCFHCRQPGHFLSECPALGDGSFGKSADKIPESVHAGVCFKCGSTEHTHFQCRVVKKDEFRFAKCFVCGEQGHISRQCPDNPRGLYPKGGACKVCGDVTHLKKDCPKYQKEQQQATVTLPTLKDADDLEALDIDSQQPTTKTSKKLKKSVVKF